MAETYGALRTTFLMLLNRSDCSVTLADTFFARAYNRINRELNGPVLDTETVVVHAGAPTGELPIPTKTVRELWVNGIPYANAPDRLTLTPEIPVLSPEAIENPSYRRVGRKVLVSPDIQSGDVIRLLHQPVLKVPASDKTDVLIENEEDLVLYAALTEAGIFYEHDNVKLWEDRYGAARDTLNDERITQLSEGGPMFLMPMAADY